MHIAPQSFWTLSQNRHALTHPTLQSVAAQHSLTAEQVFYRFVMQSGICPLNGTTSDLHMQQDLAVLAAEDLSQAEMEAIGGIIGV
jgi:diketogulonate reductase-like aldo/keto reductase